MSTNAEHQTEEGYFDDLVEKIDDLNLSLDGGNEPPKEIKTREDMESFLINLLNFAQECIPDIEEVKGYSELDFLRSRSAEYRYHGVRVKIKGHNFHLTIED
jgi:hypothetical protein